MKVRPSVVFVLLLCTVVGAQAFGATPAAPDKLQLTNKIMGAFSDVLGGVEASLRPAASKLYGILMLIEMGTLTLKLFFEDKLNIESILSMLVKAIVVWGFFWSLLQNSHMFLSAILDSFMHFGKTATGLPNLDAVSLVQQGVATVLAMINQASLGPMSFFEKPFIVLTAIVAMLLMMLAFVVAAMQLVMAQVETMIVIAAAPVLLSFGALSYTREMATNVMKHAVATGVKVLAIYILAGVMVKLGTSFAEVLTANSANLFSSPAELFGVIGGAGLMALLAFHVPTIGNSMLSGSSGLSGTSALGAAVGAAAAAATGGAAAMLGLGGAAKAAGGAATGAAAGAAGLSKALDAGLAVAGDQGLSGMAAGAHALGTVAEHGLGMAGGAIGSAAESAKSAFGGQVDRSIGGKIASSIQAGRGGSVAGMPSPSTDAGSSSTTAPANTPAPAPQNSAASGSSAPGAPAGASPQAGVAPAPEAGPVAEAGPTPSYNVPAPTAPAQQRDSLAGYTPAGDASSVTVSGAAQAQRTPSTLGRMTDALNRAGDLLDASKDHLIEDKTAVSASIDHRA